MALTNLQANITLDVYDHDGAKPSIKTIALDDNTRYVLANIRSRGEVYDIGSSATVQLIVIRPDKVGVQIAGQAQGIEIGQEDESVVTVYGAYAELDQAAIVLPGTLLGQFKITSGDQILRTQIFQILNGEALDSDTWAGDYDGYNLDELVADVAEAVEKVGDLETDVAQIKEDLTAFNTKITGNLKRADLSDTYQSDQINVLTSENDLNDCLTPNVYRAGVGTLHAPTSDMNYHVIVFLSKLQSNTRKAITQIAISSANTAQIMYVRTASVNASNVVSWNNSGNWTKINFDASQIGNGVITRDKLSDYYQSNVPLMTSGDFNTILVASNVRVNAGVQNTPDTSTGWFIVTDTIPWTVEANPRRNLIQTAYKISDPTDIYYRVYDSGPKTFTEWASLYNRKNPLKGKKIVLMGDSTYSITGANNGGHIAEILASLGDCTVYDCSFGGTRMSDSRGASSADSYKYFDFPNLVDAIIANGFADQDDHLSNKANVYTVNLTTLKAVDWSNVDILCIEYGANDFSGNVPLGDYTSNRETYTGAFIYCINALLTAYPNLHIVADGPRFRNWASAGTGYTAFNYKNTLDLLTKDYESALESVSAMHGIPMFKNLEHYGWNIYNWSYYFGTSEAHFNVNGTKYAAKALYSNLSALGFAQNL